MEGRDRIIKKNKKTEDIIHMSLYKGKQKTIEVTIHTITATKNYSVTDNGGEKIRTVERYVLKRCLEHFM